MAESLVGIRIILVEDHDDCREIFATMLRFHGAVVTAVTNAREAIGIVAHADIVVTDFSMPGGDNGAWLLDRVNEQPRPIPVIVLSAFAESQLPRLASTRFARKLLKPIDPEQLSRAIIQVLQGTDGHGTDGGLHGIKRPAAAGDAVRDCARGTHPAPRGIFRARAMIAALARKALMLLGCLAAALAAFWWSVP